VVSALVLEGANWDCALVLRDKFPVSCSPLCASWVPIQPSPGWHLCISLLAWEAPHSPAIWAWAALGVTRREVKEDPACPPQEPSRLGHNQGSHCHRAR
jgi:hypothetical protein